MPQKVSLYQLLHQSTNKLKNIEKLLIAKRIAKALITLQTLFGSTKQFQGNMLGGRNSANGA